MARRRVEIVSLSAEELELRLLRAFVRWQRGASALMRTEDLLGYLGISRSAWRRLLQEDPGLIDCAVALKGRVGQPVRWRWKATEVELRLREGGWCPSEAVA